MQEEPYIVTAARLIALHKTFRETDNSNLSGRWAEYVNWRPHWERWPNPPTAVKRRVKGAAIADLGIRS